MASRMDPPGETFLRDPDVLPSTAAGGDSSSEGRTANSRSTTGVGPPRTTSTGSSSPSRGGAPGEYNLPRFKDQTGEVPAERRGTAPSTTDPTITTVEKEETPITATFVSVEPLTVSTLDTASGGGGEQPQREPGFPPTPFAVRFQSVTFLDGLVDQIKQLDSLSACHDMYKNRIFADNLILLRSAQKEYLDHHYAQQQQQLSPQESPRRSSLRHRENPCDTFRTQWAEKWASTKNLPRTSNTEWAWILDECRKTSLCLLYRMCDICMAVTTTTMPPPPAEEEDGPASATAPAAASAAAASTTPLQELRQDKYNLIIDTIATLCLVMDRANCLYHMGHDATHVTGLAWYRPDVQHTLPSYLQNPPMGKSLMNKRWTWLIDYQILVGPTHKILAPLIQEVALPYRLQRQDP
jgi:hypothetical protein